MNVVCLVGNLVADPENKSFSSGATLTRLRLASNRKFKDKEEKLYVDVDTWGKLAELCGEYLEKGRRVGVVGRLKLDEWEDKDGNKRSKICVVADNVQFLDGKGVKESENNDDDSSSEEKEMNGDIPF